MSSDVDEDEMGMPLDSQQRKELSSDKHDPACVANNRDLTNTFLTRKYHDWEDSPRYYEEPEQIIKGKDVTLVSSLSGLSMILHQLYNLYKY